MLISTNPKMFFFSSSSSFFSTTTWKIPFSCLMAGACEAPHFPGDWLLLPWSLDIIGSHCATHVHLSLKDTEATQSAQTHSIGMHVSVRMCWVLRESMHVYWVGWVCTSCVCVSVCPHSVSQLSLQSVYVWLQGKSSSKKWILTCRAPQINSFSHIPTQKTTYLHCISPGTPFSFWWWFRDVEISPWTSELSRRETVRQR